MVLVFLRKLTKAVNITVKIDKKSYSLKSFSHNCFKVRIDLDGTGLKQF